MIKKESCVKMAIWENTHLELKEYTTMFQVQKSIQRHQ